MHYGLCKNGEIKPLWCHVVTMEIMLSLFPDVSSIVGVIVYLILSAFNKQLVTLKFENYSDMFSFVRGKKLERIFFFLKFSEALSNVSSFLSIFFGSQGGK